MTSFSQYNFFPINTPDKKADYEAYGKLESIIWTAKHIKYLDDMPQYLSLPHNERKLIDAILSFFAPSDGLISGNLCLYFIKESKNLHESLFFTLQSANELVHAEVYGSFIITWIKDEKERDTILTTADRFNITNKKMSWMAGWMTDSKPLASRFLAFACAEGIFFCNLFTIIFWFRHHGKLVNFAVANEYIRRDESLHAWYGCIRYLRQNKIDRISDVESLSIIKEATELEIEFIHELLPEDIRDLTKERLIKYCRYTADTICKMCDLPDLYGDENPFPWMIQLDEKHNFHEKGSGGNYSNYRIGGNSDRQENVDFRDVDF